MVNLNNLYHFLHKCKYPKIKIGLGPKTRYSDTVISDPEYLRIKYINVWSLNLSQAQKVRNRSEKENMAEDTLYLQLHKLSAINSEEVLDQILTTLWKTRRSGLRPPDKSRIQSLLSLPSLSELDPVNFPFPSAFPQQHDSFSFLSFFKTF